MIKPDKYKSRDGRDMEVLLNPKPGLSILNIHLTLEETNAVMALCMKKDLSPSAVIRQALRLYHQHNERLKAGETVTWSGDAQRAADFKGPSGLQKWPLPN